MTLEELERELERLHGASFGWALTCCRFNRDEADDVLQTAYLRAVEGRARYNGDSSLRTWFFSIVRHVASERRRGGLVHVEALRRWFRQAPKPESQSADDVTERAARCRQVRDVLARLSARQREVLHLVFYQELTVEQAGEVLQLPVGTARKHYQRGKARMRRLLEEQEA